MTLLLEASDLTRRYGPLLAVDSVSLELTPGSRHALIGPNGAGKSTFLNLLAGTARPTAGRIRLAGRDITRSGPARRARLGIARTFQIPAVLNSLSALDNVAVAAWRHTSLRRRWRRDDQSHRALLASLGLESLAAQEAGSLAHGQRRLLEIAIGLASNPTVLLLDEPAAGLGDDDLDRLLAVLRELPSDMAVLLIEHNQDLVAAFADTVTVLHNGQKIATGSPQDIHRDPAVARVYLGTTQRTAA